MADPLARNKQLTIYALAALALPVVSGLAYLWHFGAPQMYPAVNAGALVMGGLAILLAPAPPDGNARLIVLAVLLALLFVPLLTGPQLNHVARWVPLGPFTVHVGALVVPSLVVLAAMEERDAPFILAVALFAVSLQPDMATGAALMLAAVGLCVGTPDWKLVIFAIVAFVVSLVMAVQGELPAQPFVEHVLTSIAMESPLAALGLFAAQLGCFLLILYALPDAGQGRRALAGSFFGFAVAAIFSNYPSVLIGYGAAPILGYGLALGLLAGAAKRPAIRV